MNFLQLKSEICNEIESTLACYWNGPRQSAPQPEPGRARRATNYDLVTPNSHPQFLVTK